LWIADPSQWNKEASYEVFIINTMDITVGPVPNAIS
jgi:hypothetical protein